MRKRKNFIVMCAAAVLVTSGAAKAVIDRSENIRLLASEGSRITWKESVEYIVKEGDCLSVIASNYVKTLESERNVVEKIKYANNINDVIHPGQKLIIPIK